MRSRTLREGSVGLLIIFSVILFGGVSFWLKGIRFGESGYEIIADFPDVNGIQVGDAVRYRGLRIGKITSIRPSTNGVDVTMEISSSKLLIPRQVTIQASSSGLIGETFIDIIPEAQLSSAALKMNPLDKNCDSSQVLCQNTRLQGETGITLDDLLPYTYRFSKSYGDPEFVAKFEDTVSNASAAAAEVANLSRNVSSLVDKVEQELASISTITTTVTDIARDTSTELATTAVEINKLTKNVNELLNQNQGNLVATLDSISTTSDRLQGLVVKLDNAVDSADTEKLVANLETLTANATQASQNFKDITDSLNNPDSAVSLQQTLDSARVTFANTQKITSDLEAITGDPIFLENVKNLVDGLSNLVSYTDRLEQQIQTDQRIKPSQKVVVSPKISVTKLKLEGNMPQANNEFNSKVDSFTSISQFFTLE